MSSYAAAAKRFYEKLLTPDWMAERKKKAQAAVRLATKPNQFFVCPQVQQLLNHFKPGLRSTGQKLLIEMQDMIEHQDNWDIVMDKTKLVYVEWTALNALLLTTDLPLSQDQQELLHTAVAHYLEQEVSEMKLLNRPTTSSLKFCRVLTRNTWDRKVISDDNLLRALQLDKLWKNAEIFSKPKFIKLKHLDTLPLVATILVEIKDTKRGEDAKALTGSTVLINSQYCHYGVILNLYVEQHLLLALNVEITTRWTPTSFTVAIAKELPVLTVKEMAKMAIQLWIQTAPSGMCRITGKGCES
ncbi:hypothetical protein AX15_006096 [Amanita polypyramis BW_CC]|nr:hypothetical protein AX15_006096 [Amanita polypyramis BW_CC]